MFGALNIFFCAGIMFTQDFTVFGHLMNIHKNTEAIFLYYPNSKSTRNLYLSFFIVNIQYKFAEKKHLGLFCQIFSDLLLTVIDKTRQKKIQLISDLSIAFQA